MIKISAKQAQIRYRTLPQEIKDAFVSEENLDIVQKIGEKNHLTLGKTGDLDFVIGYILLGFVPLGDLEKEIQDFVHVPYQSSLDIGKEVREQILGRYTSVLEKIYHPLDEKDFNLVSDRRTETRNAAPRPVLMKETPGPAILRKEEAMPAPAPVPKSIPKPAGQIPKPNFPVPKPAASIPAPAASKPTAPARPQFLSPFGFQKEIRPLNTPVEFRLGGIPKPSISNVSKMPTPPRPARVELGGEEIKKEPLPAQAGKVVGREPVHYTEPKSVFMPGIGPVNTAKTPENASTPKPPAPPATPPGLQNKKEAVPIPKNYTGPIPK